jgi:hypothetical protein
MVQSTAYVRDLVLWHSHKFKQKFHVIKNQGRKKNLQGLMIRSEVMAQGAKRRQGIWDLHDTFRTE